MTEINRHELMLQAFAELAPEIRANRGSVQPGRPALDTSLREFLPLPDQSLFMGVANDGLPVLLNISNSSPGPVLIAGDSGSGKTAMLQVIAGAIEKVYNTDQILCGVITQQPEEWDWLKGSPNIIATVPAFKEEAQDLVNSLAEWAHNNHGGHQSVLLLIDDLSALMTMEFEARQNLRWLLLRGPVRRVWPIATLNPRRAPDVHPWTSFFHTRLFGRINDPGEISNLAGGAKPRLEGLRAGSEFMLREGSGWLKFWIPSVD